MVYDLNSHPEARKARRASSTSRGSILAATKEGPRAVLEALRDRIAADIDGGVPPRDLASLSKRLMELEEQLEALDSAEVGDVARAAEVPDEPL